jgi:hypothetical protein
LLHRRVFFGALVILLAAVVCFTTFYLLSDYETLKQWFLSMNNCFYMRATWGEQFFTGVIKAKGNVYATAGLVIALVGIIYIVTRRKKYFSRQPDDQPTLTSSTSWLWYLPVVAFAFVAWFAGEQNIKPSADEIFSAVNIAELPPFQGIAYYMLPNNHIYFNFINGFITRTTHIDSVLTGRILSLLAYIGVLCAAWHWFAKRLQNYFWAYVCLIPIALTFSVWAFSYQARGYELQLFCGWMAFLSLFRYVSTVDKKWLRFNAFFTIAGFAIIPTFLYIFAAQVVFLMLHQVVKRRVVFPVWKYQAIILAGVFLLYLPALCFSGKDALTTNEYVKAGHAALAEFLPRWFNVFVYFLNFIFSFVIRENHPLTFILFATPLLLVFSRRKDDRWLWLFYIVLWVVWALICIYMQRAPFSRNMIMHYSITMAFVVYTLYTFTDLLFQRVRSVNLRQSFKFVLLGVPLIFFCIHQWTWGKDGARHLLYFMDVNKMYAEYSQEIDNMAPGSSVVCTDERYCFYYYARLRGYRVHKCIEGNEDYYVKIHNEPLPEEIAKNYVLLIACAMGDDIYKHK